MYKEQYIQYKENTLFQISRLNQSETLIVFFHGIGDSHLNFLCFFEEPLLFQYDLFISDLLGHGRSSCAQNYSFDSQIEALAEQLSSLIKHYKKVIFVPHSMGGIHATLLAANQFLGKINGIYAIETSITQYGSFIAQKVFENISKNIVFSSWFQSFCNNIYFESGAKEEILRCYYVGLKLVREPAFLQNALEMYSLATVLKHKPFTHKVGEIFVNLPIPKVYCLGENGKQLSSIPFLSQNSVTIEYFATHSHWVAQACFPDFCNRLVAFANGICLK